MKKIIISATLSLLLFSACNQAQTLRTTPKETSGQKNNEFAISNVELPAYKLFFIKLEDNGKSGEKIGCGDSVIGQEIYLDEKPTVIKDQMENAFTTLLSVKPEQIPQDQQSFLGQSALSLESIDINQDNIATIKLKGKLQLNGACDAPRVQAQLEKTASQFPFLKQIDILVNDQPLSELLSSK